MPPPRQMLGKFVLLLLLVATRHAAGQDTSKVPKGFTVPGDTLSCDKHYGVTVPVLAEHSDTDNDKEWNSLRNSLLDVRTGRILTVIRAGTVGWDRMGHGEILPSRWSSDGSILIWQVDGKSSDSVLVVLKLNGDKVTWQTNVLRIGELAILARTRQAVPKKYARVKKTNASFAGGVDDPRCAYPDGFSIQVDVVDPLSFPLHVTVELTSEAKPGVAMYGFLTSHLEGILDANGKMIVASFSLGPSRPSHFAEE